MPATIWWIRCPCRPSSPRSSGNLSPNIMSSVPSSSASAIGKRFHIEWRRRAVSEGSNVFLRWARLKQKTQTAPAPVAPGEAGAGAAQAGTNAADSEPFDPASLPSIDSIVADTDIVGFLQSGVPAELTRAALRQAWLTDPAIRDFIGVADNQ